VSPYCSEVLGRSLDETRLAVAIVELTGEASPHVTELIRDSRAHHDDADDLLVFITQRLLTGDQPKLGRRKAPHERVLGKRASPSTSTSQTSPGT
jgi:hypothetical protein